MKKFIISTLAVVMLCLSANAATVAYWRLEEGTNGSTHYQDIDNYYVDQTGNGNDMSCWYKPVGITDVPAATVPQTGADDKAALCFARSKAMCVGTYDSTKPIESHVFSGGWTIECYARHNFGNRTWEGVFSKDDTADPTGTPGDEPPFAFKVNDPAETIMVIGTDDGGTYHEIQSLAKMDREKWYALAATYDTNTSTLSFYLKGEGDANYTLQGQISGLPGFSINYGTASWVVAKSQWAEGAFNDFFRGSVDEVRISDGALDPSQFLDSTGGAAVTPLAYWRFEEGTNGAHMADNDDYYKDSSGNGNSMENSNAGHALSVATTNVPYATVPKTGAADTMARTFDGNVQDVGTHGYQSSVAKSVESNPFDNGFTVECFAKATDSSWMVPVVKDGFDCYDHSGGRSGGWVDPDFAIKFRYDGDTPAHIQMHFFDGNTNWVSVETSWNWTIGEWYRIAGVCVGGTQAMLYVAQPGETTYDLEAQTVTAWNMVAGADAPVSGGLLDVTRSWSVGRGMFWSDMSDGFRGNVDEVRISDTALLPSQFLGTVPEPGMIIGGIALALLAFRRK